MGGDIYHSVMATVGGRGRSEGGRRLLAVGEREFAFFSTNVNFSFVLVIKNDMKKRYTIGIEMMMAVLSQCSNPFSSNECVPF